MSNFNDNLIDTINSQILHGNRTLNLISQSYSLINAQQQNLYLLTRMLQSNMNNNNNSNNNHATNSRNNDTISNNNNRPISNPFSIVINDISVTDISSSNLELNSILYSTLMNILSDSSLNISNDNSDNIIDISSVTILKKFGDIENPTHTTCSITLEPFAEDDEVLEIINCKHYFNCNALKTWLATNNICPVCRQHV
jgi:hypothetical protein